MHCCLDDLQREQMAEDYNTGFVDSELNADELTRLQSQADFKEKPWTSLCTALGARIFRLPLCALWHFDTDENGRVTLWYCAGISTSEPTYIGR